MSKLQNLERTVSDDRLYEKVHKPNQDAMIKQLNVLCKHSETYYTLSDFLVHDTYIFFMCRYCCNWKYGARINICKWHVNGRSICSPGRKKDVWVPRFRRITTPIVQSNLPTKKKIKKKIKKKPTVSSPYSYLLDASGEWQSHYLIKNLNKLGLM
jgi:hypothetical protein